MNLVLISAEAKLSLAFSLWVQTTIGFKTQMGDITESASIYDTDLGPWTVIRIIWLGYLLPIGVKSGCFGVR